MPGQRLPCSLRTEPTGTLRSPPKEDVRAEVRSADAAVMAHCQRAASVIANSLVDVIALVSHIGYDHACLVAGMTTEAASGTVVPGPVGMLTGATLGAAACALGGDAGRPWATRRSSQGTAVGPDGELAVAAMSGCRAH